MLESTPSQGERRKRPLHTVDAPDQQVKAVCFYLSSFEPIPASEIAIEHRDRAHHRHHHHHHNNRASSPPIDGGDSPTPTADDYANLLFYESSDEDEEGATSDDVAVDAEPARRRVFFDPLAPTVHHLLDVPPARDMTPDEVSNLWISQSDLVALKSDAHSRAQDARHRILAERDGSAHEDVGGGGSGRGGKYGNRASLRSFMSIVERESDASIRGLEHRLFRSRHTRHALVRDVLECQAHATGLAKFGMQGVDGKERAMLLARVSMERSVKARNLAFVDAMEDRAEVLNGL
ncbi:hypothetical protein ACHAW5_007908 [Stephanodiscus triporus]|uniref:Uncharacterized protein n=1 Tax=Stephanodiscus triporus TaxID=2934178 RepID=A0ABD3PPB1_9STRA